MGRTTRAKAAQVADELHVDVDVILEIPDENAVMDIKAQRTPEPPSSERMPLGELAPNSAESKSPSDESLQELKKSTRAKKGAAKGKKNKKRVDLAASTASRGADADDELPEVLPDDRDSAPSPASDEAAEELLDDSAAGAELHTSHLQVLDTRATTPPSAAVRLTRSQLAKLTDEEQGIPQVEPKSLMDGLGQTTEEQRLETGLQIDTPAILTEDAPLNKEPMTYFPIDAPASPMPDAVPRVVTALRQDGPTKRSTSNKENIEPPVTTPGAESDGMRSPPTEATPYDALEHAVVTAGTPPRSARRSSSRPEDHIDALDQLDDAVENMVQGIPEVRSSPEKPKAKREPKPAPIVKTTKATQARLSMALGSKDAPSKPPALGRPRPSTSTSRSISGSSKPDTAAKRILSNGSTKSTNSALSTNGEKEVVIPHSKPRPISLSFPTPPPPAKSTKAPTQSNFKLPGEAVAEKLKAAREARMAKDADEDVKKKAFKARPVPASVTRGPAVRPTNASKARESVMGVKDAKVPTTAAAASATPRLAGGHKRANSVAATSAPKPRIPSKDSGAAKAGGTLASSKTNSLAGRNRASTAMGNLSQPRASVANTSRPLSSIGAASARVPAKGTVKGKEVFNRAAVAKAEAEKEKREKEEAAKKARAAAAERGRQASREWAEKQKLKKMGVKPTDNGAALAATGATNEVVSETGGAVTEQPSVETADAVAAM